MQNRMRKEAYAKVGMRAITVLVPAGHELELRRFARQIEPEVWEAYEAQKKRAGRPLSG
jgi:hypothetical protein